MRMRFYDAMWITLSRTAASNMVDEFKGRIAQNRRWPAGLQSAVEAKERVRLKTQGRILGSITVQSMTQMYERICGMTGTAATQAEEFWDVYKLAVAVIRTNRPVIRQDLPDVVFADSESTESSARGGDSKSPSNRSPDSGGNGKRGGVRGIERSASTGRYPAFGPECKERRGGSGNYRPSRSAGSGDGFH